MKNATTTAMFAFVLIGFAVGCGVSNVEDAHKHIVGTWTYTGQGYVIFGEPHWIKWVFKTDGTLDEYIVKPNSDNWGKPMERTWKATTGKFSDSGKRYYGAHVDYLNYDMTINRDGTLSYYQKSANQMIVGDINIFLKKGDRFPFSK